MKPISLFFLIAVFAYGLVYALPIKLRLLKKLDGALSAEKIKELAKAGDSDAIKIIKAEKVILALGLLAIVFLFLSYFSYIEL